jgi:hypothetical protein
VDTGTGTYAQPVTTTYPATTATTPQGVTYNTPAGAVQTTTSYNNGYSPDQLASMVNLQILSPTGTQSGNPVYFEGTTGLNTDERRVNVLRPYWIVTGGNLKTPRQFSGVTNSQRFSPGTYTVEFYALDKYRRRYSTTSTFQVAGAPSAVVVTQ